MHIVCDCVNRWNKKKKTVEIKKIKQGSKTIEMSHIDTFKDALQLHKIIFFSKTKFSLLGFLSFF